MMRRMPGAWQSVVEDLARRCGVAGLDLVRPFEVGWYNAVVDGALRLPDLGRASALGVLIGNTRALWPRFVDALRADPSALDEPDPLDRFVSAAVRRALQTLGHRHEVRFAPEPPPRRIAMQRLAHVSGLAHLAPSHLCVHSTYGPWIGLRAAVVVDLEGPAWPPSEPPNPCQSCERDCLPKLREAARGGDAAVEARWERWLAVRDACPVGRAHRYGEDQIRYHYTKDREGLRRLVAGREP